MADHGSVFRADDDPAILRAWDMAPTDIEPGKPWPQLMEAPLKGQLRLADFTCEPADTLEDIPARHAAFMATCNTTRHWAHQEREDGRRTPVEVLEWVRGRPVERAPRQRLFGAVPFIRTVTRYGVVRVPRFSLSADPGLSRPWGAIGSYEGHRRLESQGTRLARYRCVYHQRRRRIQDVSAPTCSVTPFASPPLE